MVTAVVLTLLGLKLVALKLAKNAFVEVTDVPLAVVNVRPPTRVPPASGR